MTAVTECARCLTVTRRKDLVPFLNLLLCHKCAHVHDVCPCGHEN
jgi:hypothetical protein